MGYNHAGVMKLRLYPLCDRDITLGNVVELAKQCLPCEGIKHAFNEENAEVYKDMGKLRICNPNIETYPLPIQKCEVCDKHAINGVFASLLFIALWVVLANIWSLIVWTSNKRFKRSQIYFKMSLACSNLLFGLTVLPCVVYAVYHQMYTGHAELYDFGSLLNYTRTSEYYEHWTRLFTPTYIQFTGIIFIVANGANVCSFLMMSVDRYLALALSLRYHKIMTKRRCLFIIVLCWVANISVGVISLVLMIKKKFIFRSEPGALFLPLPIFTTVNDGLYMLVFMIPYIFVFIANIVIIVATAKAISSTASPGKHHNIFKDISASFTSSVTKNFSVFTSHHPHTPKVMHPNNSDVFEISVFSVKSAGGETDLKSNDENGPQDISIPIPSVPTSDSSNNNVSAIPGYDVKTKRKKRVNNSLTADSNPDQSAKHLMRMCKSSSSTTKSHSVRPSCASVTLHDLNRIFLV